MDAFANFVIIQKYLKLPRRPPIGSAGEPRPTKLVNFYRYFSWRSSVEEWGNYSLMPARHVLCTFMQYSVIFIFYGMLEGASHVLLGTFCIGRIVLAKAIRKVIQGCTVPEIFDSKSLQMAF